MKREFRYYFAGTVGLFFLGSMVTGCLKESHHLDGSTQFLAPTSSWFIPLGALSISTNDLPENLMESNGVAALGAAFVWADSLEAITVDPSDWLLMESSNCSFERAFAPEEVLAFNALPKGETTTFEIQESLEATLIEGCVIHQLDFASGMLRVRLNVPEGMSVSSTIALPDLTTNGTPMEVVCGPNETVDWPLENATLRMQADGLSFDVVGQLELTSGVATLSEGTNLQWQFEWIDPVLNRFEGLLSSADAFVHEETVAFEAPDWLQGNLALSEAALVLEVSNGQGVRLGLGFEGELLGGQMTQAFRWQPAQPAIIDAATEATNSAMTTLKLDNSNTLPPIGSWLNPNLEGIAYRASLELLPPKNQWQFIEAGQSISITPRIELPFIGYVERVEWSDTLAFDLRAMLTNELPAPFGLEQLVRLAICIEVSNGLPLGLEASTHFHDANGELIATGLEVPVQLLASPSMVWQGAFQLPEAPGETRWEIAFAGSDLIELLEQDVQMLSVTLVGQTPSATESIPVAFGPGQNVALSAALAFDINPSLP